MAIHFSLFCPVCTTKSRLSWTVLNAWACTRVAGILQRPSTYLQSQQDAVYSSIQHGHEKFQLLFRKNYNFLNSILWLKCKELFRFAKMSELVWWTWNIIPIFRLNAEDSIQMVTALALQLIQCVVKLPTISEEESTRPSSPDVSKQVR